MWSASLTSLSLVFSLILVLVLVVGYIKKKIKKKSDNRDNKVSSPRPYDTTPLFLT